jgi:hypothetical protein
MPVGLPSFLGPKLSHISRGKDLIGLIPHCQFLQHVSLELI